MIEGLKSSKLMTAVQKCIEECLHCYSTCLNTAVEYCLEMGGKHSEPAHIRLMLDCAETCRYSADMMLRASAFHSQACKLCADVCNQCAESCKAFEDDERMKACSEACERCAESCLEMSEA